MRDLTDRQRRVLAVICDHITETGVAPGMREIAAAVGLSSTG